MSKQPKQKKVTIRVIPTVHSLLWVILATVLITLFFCLLLPDLWLTEIKERTVSKADMIALCSGLSSCIFAALLGWMSLRQTDAIQSASDESDKKMELLTETMTRFVGQIAATGTRLALRFKHLQVSDDHVVLFFDSFGAQDPNHVILYQVSIEDSQGNQVFSYRQEGSRPCILSNASLQHTFSCSIDFDANKHEMRRFIKCVEDNSLCFQLFLGTRFTNGEASFYDYNYFETVNVDTGSKQLTPTFFCNLQPASIKHSA